MKHNRIIALSGWKKSGKDTASEILIKEHGFTRISFADPLKDMVAEEYGIERSWLDNPEFKESPLLNLPVEPKDDFSKMLHMFMVREFRTKQGDGPEAESVKIEDGKMLTLRCGIWEQLYQTPRSLAILKGSVNRSVRSNYWVKKAIQAMKSKETNAFVISDLRYKSELEQLRKAFKDSLTTIRINRFDTNPSTDPSENDLDDVSFDFVIENRGTKEEFFEKLKETISQIQDK